MDLAAPEAVGVLCRLIPVPVLILSAGTSGVEPKVTASQYTWDGNRQRGPLVKSPWGSLEASPSP